LNASAPFQAVRAEVARGRGKYCSRACSVKSRRRGSNRPCRFCKKPFVVYQWNKEIAKFCSRKCKHASQRKVRTVREIAQRRLEVRIAALMGYSLKGKKAGCRWESLVGYTLARLMRHLERKFAPGMSWGNIGKWHIDHKRPRSSFVYDSPDDPQFQACWALKNLQPLWAIDNLSKGARLDWRPL
jgi:hypothetical protein